MCQLLASRDPRPRSAVFRTGQAVPILLLLGLCMGLGTVTGCDLAPRPGRRDPQRTTGAAVDGCRGVADGALCNDRNACTLDDHCLGGLCVGTNAPDGMSCTDDNQCTAADLCLKGKCQGSPVADGTLCTDGDPCTDPDTCRKGQCTAGGPLSCDDGDLCTTDQCIEGDGCRHDPIPLCSDAGGGGDGGTPDGDGGGPPDVAPTDAGPDAAEVEVGTSGDAADEAPPDAMIDSVLPDVPPDDAGLDATEDTLVDAGTDAEPADAADGGDAASDASTTDIVPVYQARGGACVCSSSPGEAPGPAAGAGAVLLAAVLARRRRRAPR